MSDISIKISAKADISGIEQTKTSLSGLTQRSRVSLDTFAKTVIGITAWSSICCFIFIS